MEVGITAANKRKYMLIEDRREAIKTAVNLAAKEDIVLIAGKGHEKYQEIMGMKYPFDDKQILIDCFETR
jgi:UDP-N-acetylmuramoyl-L-alanyl-D-glutamate--2,6-diaminopimelate ligase